MVVPTDPSTSSTIGLLENNRSIYCSKSSEEHREFDFGVPTRAYLLAEICVILLFVLGTLPNHSKYGATAPYHTKFAHEEMILDRWRELMQQHSFF